MLRNDGVHSDGEGVKKHTLEWGLCDPDEVPDYNDLAARLAAATTTDQEKSRPLFSVSKVRNVKKGKPRLSPTSVAGAAKQKSKTATPAFSSNLAATNNSPKSRKQRKIKRETLESKFESDEEADDEKERTKDEERNDRTERGGEREQRARSSDTEKEKTKERRVNRAQATSKCPTVNAQSVATTAGATHPPSSPTSATNNQDINIDVNTVTNALTGSGLSAQQQNINDKVVNTRGGQTSAAGGDGQRQHPKQRRSTSVAQLQGAQLKKKPTQIPTDNASIPSSSERKPRAREWHPLTVNEWLKSLGVSAACISTFAMHHITLDLLSSLTERELDAMGITIVGDRLKILRGLQQWRDKYSMAYQHSAKTQQHSGPTTSSLPMSSSGHTPPVRLPLSDSALTTAITRTTPSSLAVSAESDSNKADPSMLLNCVPVTLSAPTPSSFSSEQTSECYEEHNLISQLLADMTLLHTLHTQYCHKFNELFERLNRQLETMAKSQKIAPRPRVNVSNSGADAPSASLQSSNYFVSLRINNKDVQRRVSEIQAKLKEIVPGVAKYLLPVEQLHFTLARLALHTPQQVESAKQILDFVGSDIYRAIYKGKPMTVTFKGFSNYGDNVIFIEVEKGENRDLLTEFGSAVFEHFRSANLTSKDSFRFLPAVPILRTKSKGTAGKKKLLALTETHPKFLSSYDHTILGVQTFSAVEISDHVSKQYDKDGYYKALYIKELPKE